MQNHVENQQISLWKTMQFTASFKDDIRQLADLTLQISQQNDISSQHSDIFEMCCKVISSFVIFAVSDLRVGGCRH